MDLAAHLMRISRSVSGYSLSALLLQAAREQKNAEAASRTKAEALISKQELDQGKMQEETKQLNKASAVRFQPLLLAMQTGPHMHCGAVLR